MEEGLETPKEAGQNKVMDAKPKEEKSVLQTSE